MRQAATQVHKPLPPHSALMCSPRKGLRGLIISPVDSGSLLVDLARPAPNQGVQRTEQAQMPGQYQTQHPCDDAK